MIKAEAVFDKHFPESRDHPQYWVKVFVKLGNPDKRPAKGWDWRGLHNAAHLFEEIAFNQFPVVYNRASDLRALDDLRRSITKLEQLLKGGGLSRPAERRLRQRIRYGQHAEEMPCDDAVALSDHLMEIGITDGSDTGGDGGLRDYIDEFGKQSDEALSNLLNAAPLIKKAIDRTISDIELSPRTRKAPKLMNLKGVQCVHAARILWEEQTGKPAPSKDLNEASAFGRFLADLFEVYEIGGEPKSAFRAWAKLT